LHGMHVHEFRIGTGGDTSCLSTGGHWNPDGMNHGTNLDWQRHVGDLGNILADENGVAEGTLLAYVPLKGDYGIAKAAVVVHAGSDDLGLGGNNDSRANGNAGTRVLCGNVEISYEK
jgi:superoxide dismutase, Cu-Zn family